MKRTWLFLSQWGKWENVIKGYTKRLRERKIWLSNKSRSVFNKIQDQFKKLSKVRMNGYFLNLRCYQISSLMSIYNAPHEPCTKNLSFCKGTRKKKVRRLCQINAQPHSGTILTGQETLWGWRSLSLVLLSSGSTVTFGSQTYIGLYWWSFSRVHLHCVYLYQWTWSRIQPLFLLIF